MSTVTLRIPDEKHRRLKQLAKTRRVSVNKLLDEWATVALASHDAETRFRALAARGHPARGLRMLDELASRERTRRVR
jgi:predicted DNA-binding ribbon-helix-helix protein